AEPLGHRVEGERALVVAHEPVVDRHAWELARLGAGGDDDVLRLDGLLAGPYLPGRAAGDQGPLPLEPGDLVLAKEAGDARGHLVDDAVLAREHGLQVEPHARGGDAVRLEVMLDALVVLRGLEERLGRDAAHVEAGAAQPVLARGVLPLFHAGGGEPELRRPDGGNVAGGAHADDDDVEGLHRQISRIRRAGSSRASLIATRKSTASRPSMMRWS